MINDAEDLIELSSGDVKTTLSALVDSSRESINNSNNELFQKVVDNHDVELKDTENKYITILVIVSIITLFVIATLVIVLVKKNKKNN